MGGVPVRNLARALRADEFEPLAEALAAQGSIRRAVDWLARHDPPIGLTDVVAMDEFCHDILAEFDGGLFLVYDTT